MKTLTLKERVEIYTRKYYFPTNGEITVEIYETAHPQKILTKKSLGFNEVILSFIAPKGRNFGGLFILDKTTDFPFQLFVEKGNCKIGTTYQVNFFKKFKVKKILSLYENLGTTVRKFKK